MTDSEDDHVLQERSAAMIDIMHNPQSKIDDDYDDNGNLIIINGWTRKNIKTVQRWKDHTARTIFIYETISEKYKKRLGIFSVLILLLAAIVTLIATISSTLSYNSETTYTTIVFWLSIIIAIFASITSLLQSIKSITKWDDLIMDSVKYIEKLNVFYVNVSNQLNVPVDVRIDASSFIRMASAEYQYIIGQTPEVFNKDLITANRKYEKFLNNMRNEMHKHNQKLDLVSSSEYGTFV